MPAAVSSEKPGASIHRATPASFNLKKLNRDTSLEPRSKRDWDWNDLNTNISTFHSVKALFLFFFQRSHLSYHAQVKSFIDSSELDKVNLALFPVLIVYLWENSN